MPNDQHDTRRGTGPAHGWQYLAAIFVLALLVVWGAAKWRSYAEAQAQAKQGTRATSAAAAGDAHTQALFQEAVREKGKSLVHAMSSVDPTLLSGSPDHPQAVHFAKRMVEDPNIVYVALLDGRGRTAVTSDLKRATEKRDINTFTSVVVTPLKGQNADLEVRGPIYGADGAHIGGVCIELKY
jgi:hypothetical protein